MISDAFLKKKLPVCALVGIILLSYLRLGILKDAIQNALSLCAFSVVPSLFPFLLFTEFFCQLPEGKELLLKISKPFARILRTSNAGACAYVYGLLFGFPLGVKILAEYYKKGWIEKKEAERLLLFSNNTGPAFLIGTIGIGFLKNALVGVCLYLVQLAVSLLFGIVASVGSPPPKNSSACFYYTLFPFSFSSAMKNAVFGMLFICGYIIFFSAFCTLLAPFIPTVFLQSIFFSLMEIGTASAFVSQNIPTPFLYAFLSFAVCFSGASVYMQGIDHISDTDLSKKKYIPAKLLQGIAAFFMVLIFYIFKS